MSFVWIHRRSVLQHGFNSHGDNLYIYIYVYVYMYKHIRSIYVHSEMKYNLMHQKNSSMSLWHSPCTHYYYNSWYWACTTNSHSLLTFTHSLVYSLSYLPIQLLDHLTHFSHSLTRPRMHALVWSFTHVLTFSCTVVYLAKLVVLLVYVTKPSHPEWIGPTGGGSRFRNAHA